MTCPDVCESSICETVELWNGDRGCLSEEARRACVHLLRDSFLDGREKKEAWKALQINVDAIRSRFNDLFLDLVVSEESRIAYVIQVEPEGMQVPRLMRRQRLNLIDSYLLICLRKLLLDGESRGESVLVDEKEISDQLQPLAEKCRDDSAFRSHVSGAIKRAKELKVLQKLRDTQVYEVSPVIKFLLTPEMVCSTRDAYLAMSTEEVGTALSRAGSRGNGDGRNDDGGDDE